MFQIYLQMKKNEMENPNQKGKQTTSVTTRPNIVDKKVLIFVFKQFIFSQNISEFGHYLYCHLAIHKLYQVL